eukprot:7372624-Pyramimonas_sp.AAC.1
MHEWATRRRRGEQGGGIIVHPVRNSYNILRVLNTKRRHPKSLAHCRVWAPRRAHDTTRTALARGGLATEGRKRRRRGDW